MKKKRKKKKKKKKKRKIECRLLQNLLGALRDNNIQGSMKLKVYIEDHDDNSNDYVDYVQTIISLTPAKSEGIAYPRSYYLRRRTR